MKSDDEKKTKEDVAKDFLKKTNEDKEEESGFNFMELLQNPGISELLKSGKDLFKKEKVDPNVCEITIKAPSEVVLKLFRVKE